MKLFAVIVVFIISFLVLAVDDSPYPAPSPGGKSQPVQEPGADEDQKAGTPNAVSKDSPFLINRQYSAVVGKTEVQDSSGQPSQSPSDNRIVWLTMGLLIATSVQAFIYWRQAGLMVQGLEIAEKSARATRDSADAAKLGAEAAMESAKAATKSADVAETTMRVGQRAYLVAGQSQVKNIEGEKTVEALCPFVNTGHTPAVVTANHVYCCMAEALPQRPDYSQLSAHWEGRKLLPAGGITLLSADGPHVGTAELREMKDIPMRLYFYGRIAYDDVFGGHWTTTFFTYYDRGNKVMLPIEREGYNYTT